MKQKLLKEGRRKQEKLAIRERVATVVVTLVMPPPKASTHQPAVSGSTPSWRERTLSRRDLMIPRLLQRSRAPGPRHSTAAAARWGAGSERPAPGGGGDRNTGENDPAGGRGPTPRLPSARGGGPPAGARRRGPTPPGGWGAGSTEAPSCPVEQQDRAGGVLGLTGGVAASYRPRSGHRPGWGVGRWEHPGPSQTNCQRGC